MNKKRSKNIVHKLLVAAAIAVPPVAIPLVPFATVGRLITSQLTDTSDTKSLVLLSENMDGYGAETGIKALFPGAAVIHGQHKNLDQIVQTVVDRVKEQKAPFDELVLEMDSVPNKILFTKGLDGTFTTEGKFSSFDLLNKLIIAQEKLGRPLVKRLGLLGCNIFTDQTAQSVNFYKAASARLGAEIFGTRSNFIGGIWQTARFVVFKKNDVTPDRLDNPYDPQALLSMAMTAFRAQRHDNVLDFSKENSSGSKRPADLTGGKPKPLIR